MNRFLKQCAPILLIVACVFILTGIVLLALLVPNAASTFYRVCLVDISVLSLAMGVCLLYVLYLARDNDPNFFLYDAQTGRNIPAEELSFDRVNSRMSYFMTTLSGSQERLWADNVLDLGNGKADRFGVQAIYRPLAAYKMLYDLIELDRPECWQFFLCASPAVIDSLTDALMTNGEDAMAKSLRHAYDVASGRDDFEWLRDYVMGNKKYISRRMMGYVQKNMKWFY